MKKLLNLVAVPLLAVVVAGGAASAATSTNVDTTGPDSEAVVDVTNDNDVDLQNNNNTNAAVSNNQTAQTGEAEVEHNTTGEDATSGDADTEFAVVANVEHTNASSSEYALRSGDCGCGDVDTNIENTGPDSTVEVTVANTNEVEVTNNNNFNLTVSNNQSSTSGDASVEGNTTGGGAHSGGASASASVEIDHYTSN